MSSGHRLGVASSTRVPRFLERMIFVITKSFDPDTNQILSPEHLAKAVSGFPEILVVTFFRKLVNEIVNNYSCETLCTTSDGRRLHKMAYGGRNLAVLRSSVGAPITVALLEEAIVMGAKKILVFGSCGVLDSKRVGNNIIVPTHAYRDEGTSYHYAAPSEDGFIEIPTSRKMSNILKSLKIPFVEGKIWTTDAIFRETKKNVELRKQMGCIAVEMECAAIMAMAAFRGVPAYQFIFPADILESDGWNPGSWDFGENMERKSFAGLAVEVACKI